MRDNLAMDAVQSLTATWLNCGVQFVWVTQQCHCHRHSRVTMSYLLPKIGKHFHCSQQQPFWNQCVELMYMNTFVKIGNNLVQRGIYSYIFKFWSYLINSCSYIVLKIEKSLKPKKTFKNQMSRFLFKKSTIFVC